MARSKWFPIHLAQPGVSIALIHTAGDAPAAVRAAAGASKPKTFPEYELL
jgi:hypothetical protein